MYSKYLMTVELKILLLMLISVYSEAYVHKFLRSPYKNSLELLERNEKVLQNILKTMDTSSENLTLDSFRSVLQPYMENLDDRYSKLRNESESYYHKVLRQANSVGININRCANSRYYQLEEYTPRGYFKVILDCFLMYASEPFLIDYQPDLRENASILLQLNGRAKKNLRDCINVDEDPLRAMECLKKSRYAIEEIYSFKILPLKREIEKTPNFAEDAVQHADKCFNNNFLLRQYWKKLEEINQDFKNCIITRFVMSCRGQDLPVE